MQRTFAITVERSGSPHEASVLKLSGEILAESVEEIEHKIVGAARESERIHSVVLDLSNCWFSELDGVICFFRYVNRFAEDGGAVYLVVRPGSFVERALERISRYHRITVHKSLTDALDAVDTNRINGP